MANYRTHVSVGACAGLLTIGVSSLWLHQLGWDILLLGVFFGFLGGMIPDIDHDRGHAVAEIGRLLSTMLPVVSLAVWAHGRGQWVVWSLTVVIPNHYLLHWALPQMSWWGKVRRGTVKNALQSILVAGVCAAPTLFLFPRLPFGYQKTWLVMVGIAAAVQIAIPVFKTFTVHRGMLHSVPFAVVFAEVVFLFLQPFSFHERALLALAGLTGALSHLILDEIYSVDFDNRKLVRIKRSFGTAFKFWTSRYPAASAMAYAFAIGLGVLSWMWS
ncbi:MAG: hypothetical protein EP343_28930 [Deltaproteobacteria bacterium]|nr:MAG: hypothetical protein EP343_28930 [Deltaproteobacteria bacterium]